MDEQESRKFPLLTPNFLIMNVQDRRRLLGPPNAKPISFSLPIKNIKESTKKIGDERLISMHTGLIENCNGSSLVEFNDPILLSHQSSIITSVYGPRALRGSFTSNASLSIRLENGSMEKYSNPQLKEVSTFLSDIFNSVVNRSRYPKSGIDIFLYLTYDKDLNSDTFEVGHLSSIIPYCIMGVTLALIDGGIEILDMANAGVHDGSVFAFLKNGQEIAGFWKDEGNCEDIMHALQPCKEEYFRFKELMVRHLMENGREI